MDLQICRLCLRGSEHLLNIFEFDQNKPNIAHILRLHFWFEILPNDEISTVICNVCWTQVSEFHQFYMCVQEAQKRYEMKPILKEELLPPTWHEEVLLPSEVLTIENTDTVNPLDEHALPQNIFKKEVESVMSDDFDVADEKREEDGSESESSEDSETDEEFIAVTTRSGKRKKNDTSPKTKKTIRKSSSKKSKTKKELDTIFQKQQWPPFCEKDEELIKKFIVMACDLCLFLADNFEGIREHFKENHAGVKPFVKCCGRKLGKRCLIVEHARRHENPEYIKCKDCGKVFSNSSVLRAHWLVHHVPDEACKYKCDQCEKRFSKQNLLELHKATHLSLEERKFVCDLCTKYNAFATEYHLQVHKSMQHRKAPNVCHVCGKEIRDKSVFEKHVRLHFEDSGPRVKCPRPNCDRWLKDEDNLKQHLKRHNDEGKEFLCKECGKNCKNRRALVSHVRYSHTNTVYTCEQCQKTFKKDISLKEHMAQHTGEPLYKCPFCPRTFNSNANMHSHKKKMHPIEWDIWRKTKRGSSQTILPSAQVAQAYRGQVDMMLPNCESL